MAAQTDLLDPSTVVAYLAGRGLIDERSARVQPLGGGVSNVVLAVDDATRSVVVKQALPRLRVPDVWEAPQQRAVTEAEALRLAESITPGAVAPVLDTDADRFVLTLQRAPAGWRDWKGLLLEGTISPAVAGRLGTVLSAWHTATLGGRGLSAGMNDPFAFEQLRVDPYYRTVARRAPETAEAILGLVAAMERRRLCLVHGDFSPKNVLVSPDQSQSWVIDLEVAHFGDPVFDVGFLLSHLLLKSLRQPRDRPALAAGVTAFADTYTAGVRGDLVPEWSYVNAHVGALLLARVRGKSPVEYLSDLQSGQAWELGGEILARPPSTLRGLLAACEAVIR